MTIFIDIGGTPANILERSLLSIAIANEFPQEKIVAILDPFDLSRAERRLELGNYKVKSLRFSVKVPENKTNLNSEAVNPPTAEECIKLFDSTENIVLGKIQGIYGKKVDIEKIKNKYRTLKQKVLELTTESGNLREFMNGLVNLLSPGLKTIRLEEILSQNSCLIYQILKEIDIPVRAICPSCSCFTQMSLREPTKCCNFPQDEIIKSGRYIPQGGFLPVITYLCGYLTLSSNKEKIQQTSEIMKKIRREGNPILPYKKPQEERTMFEYFLLGGQNEA